MFPFFIIGADGKPHIIYIMDIIGETFWEAGVTAKMIIQALSSIDENDDVEVYINSRGGFTDEGTAIYNALADRPGNVTTIIQGYASSMATVVMCAADKVQAYETALGMTHKASTALWGNADDFRAQAEMLDKVDDAICIAYGRKMGIKPEEAKAYLTGDRDKWHSAEEMLAMGLIDEIITPQKFAVVLDKNARNVLAQSEGACLMDPLDAPSSLLPHIKGVEGIMAVRVGPNSVDVTKLSNRPANSLPAEDPPAEDPPAEDPPAEDPPAEDPPAEDPPAEDPPAEDPPAEDPPAEDPPAEDPPAEDPPADDPAATERKRISAILAIAAKNGFDSNEPFIKGLIEDGTLAAQAGKQILAVKAASVGGGSQQQPPITDQQTSSWGNVYKSNGVKTK